jgi:hypothetical protein
MAPEKPETAEDRGTQVAAAEGMPPQCTCVQDPFAALPPELRPPPAPKKGGLRKVTCPGCGLVYWTNRKTDLCPDCEKKGLRLLETGEVIKG